MGGQQQIVLKAFYLADEENNMKIYSITVSDSEEMAFSYAAINPQEWIENAVRDRIRIAEEEIIRIAVNKCLETGTPIPSTKEEIIQISFSNGWVVAASERQ